MENQEETVILEIEGSPIECSKKVLIENSDYFAIMFKGSFKESSQKRIKIEGVNLKPFNIILLLLWDQSYVVDINEIHMVLQAACMLQFNSVKKICEDRILELLSPSVCIKIWKTAELLDISPLWIKAKSMALEEFDQICDSNPVLELSLDDICMYLGHVHLKVHNELTVFQTAMSWWYENQEVYENLDYTKILLRLLNCIDFKQLNDHEIKEMQTYPDITDNSEIVSVLNCIRQLLGNELEDYCEFSNEHVKYASHMCNSKSRQVPEIPCILLQTIKMDDCAKKKPKSHGKNYKNLVIYDKFHRRRNLLDISECSTHDRIFLNADISMVTYDGVTNEFRDFFSIDGDKIMDLKGFKFLPYKEFVLFYGGEYFIGAGAWNSNVWSYNTVKEKWERKSVLPQGRRHFETVMVGDCIYIVGGVGKFRVIQENLLWYDFKSDEWSPVISLPYNTNQFKCCSFNGKLFIVYLSEKKGFIFNSSLKTWRSIGITIEKEVASDMGDFTVFSDSQYIYVKGKHLIKFQLDGDTLVPISQRIMKDIDYEEIEVALCNNIVYTLYKCLDEHYDFFYTFEALNLDTGSLQYIFRNKILGQDPIEVGDKLFCPTQYTKLFSIHYYYLVRENVFINDFLF